LKNRTFDHVFKVRYVEIYVSFTTMFEVLPSAWTQALHHLDFSTQQWPRQRWSAWNLITLKPDAVQLIDVTYVLLIHPVLNAASIL